MPTIHATSLYKFIRFCNAILDSGDQQEPKIVLDCGAGGILPPLTMFQQAGYQVIGIDRDLAQIKKATQNDLTRWEKKLNFIVGTMKKIPLARDTVSCVYSYNTFQHLHKNEVMQAINELVRVTKKHGLIFINFLLDSSEIGYRGTPIGAGTYIIENTDAETQIRSYFTEKEVEDYLRNLTIIYREKRCEEWLISTLERKECYFDYIIQNK